MSDTAAQRESAPAPRSRMSRDIAGIFGTRVLWMLMGMVSGVILARYLGPHDRGILALVLMLPMTAETLVKLGITQANIYLMNRKAAPVTQVIANCIVLALTLGVLSAAVVWLSRGLLVNSVLRGVPTWALSAALARVPLLLLDHYLYGVLQATGRFSVYNRRLLLGEALRLVLVVTTVAILGYGLPAAVLLYLVVNIINVALLLVAMRGDLRFPLPFNATLLREQLSFGTKSYVQTVTAHLLLRISVYMVSYFLGPAPTAFYSLALHLTEMVLEIPQAVGLVLFPRLTSLPKNEVHRLTAQACRRTLLITAPLALALAVLGPYVITLWYGSPYAPAGAPLPWAAVGVVMMSFYVIVTRDFTSRNRQQVNITAGLVALGSNVVLNLFLIPAYGIVGAAAATAISYSAACLLLLALYLSESRASLTDVLIARPDDWRYFREMMAQGLLRARRLIGAGPASARR
jgi:O-antigen/teichoic acid export membrane protein